MLARQWASALRSASAVTAQARILSAVRTFADKPQPKISVVSHPYSLTGKPLDTAEADKFAVIEFSGRQYKVTKNDVIVADKLHDVELGQVLELDQVLLVGTQMQTIVGRPLVENAKVVAQVEEMKKDAKVIVFKKRRRQNYRRKKGFRRDVTMLRILDIAL